MYVPVACQQGLRHICEHQKELYVCAAGHAETAVPVSVVKLFRFFGRLANHCCSGKRQKKHATGN
jgi:hypothetical protein